MGYNAPLSTLRAQQLIEILPLHSASQVIDLGCGEGVLLQQLQRHYDCHALGLDIDQQAITKANGHEKLQFEVQDLSQPLPYEAQFDAALCIGSSHAFASGEQAYPEALKEMTKLLKPGGVMLIGEGYWQATPAPEYLAFLGEPSGIYHSHQQNMAFAEELGLVAAYGAEATLDEWDHFEGQFRLQAEYEALANPDDPEAQQKLQRIRNWNQHYHRFGRGTMGFGYYLFIKPL